MAASDRQEETMAVDLPRILELPQEVLDAVFRVLRPADLAAFTITAKASAYRTGLKALNLDFENRLSLLRRLENLLPNHLLCYQCAIFHPRLGLDRPRRENDLTSCDLRNKSFTFGSQMNFLPFTRAQSVMNRHRFGPEYGIPVKDLETRSKHGIQASRFQYRSPHYPTGPRADPEIDSRSHLELPPVIETLDAKIVNDELFVKTTVRTRYFRGFNAVEFPDERNFLRQEASCHHIPRSDLYQTEGPTFQQGVFLRCASCQTETMYKLHLTGRNTYETVITAWRNLGRCQDPRDLGWILAVENQEDPHNNKMMKNSEARLVNSYENEY